MSLPQLFTIPLKQGADWSYTWLYQTGSPLQAVDLTGYAARLQVRQQYTDAAPVLLITDVLSSSGQVLLQQGLSTQPATAAGVLGWVKVTITKAASLAFSPVSYGFDLFLDSPGGLTYPLLTGPVSVTPSFIR